LVLHITALVGCNAHTAAAVSTHISRLYRLTVPQTVHLYIQPTKTRKKVSTGFEDSEGATRKKKL
jgi:hypothetical protein